MTPPKLRHVVLFTSLFFGAGVASLTTPLSAAPLTYKFVGQVTDVFENQNNVIPNLAVGDSFTGYTTFESAGWHGTSGTVFVALNGVDLLFTGDSIYGNVTLGPANRYSIRIAADTAGAGADITGSTFSAGNFGPTLTDADGSAGYAVPFPQSLDLSHFETNVFLISGTLISGGQRISANGRLTQFVAVPEPTSLLACCAPILALIAPRRRVPRRVACFLHPPSNPPNT